MSARNWGGAKYSFSGPIFPPRDVLIVEVFLEEC